MWPKADISEQEPVQLEFQVANEAITTSVISLAPSDIAIRV
jgi:hypothetical protein